MTETTAVLKTDALGRVKISGEHREALLDAFDRAGTTGLEFARLHGVNYQTFATWVQKRRRERGRYPAVKAVPGESLKLTLAEVGLPPAAIASCGGKAAAGVEITFPGGLSIRVPDSAAIPLAVELANALKALCPC